MECPICINKFTSTVRKRISCPHCHQEACTPCIQKYILESSEDPDCLFCRKEISRFFLQQNLPKSFIDGPFAKKRAEILWRREQSFIPQAQIQAQRIVASENYDQENIKPVREIILELNRRKKELEEKLEECYIQFNKGFRIKEKILRGEIDIETGKPIKDKTEKAKFIRKCAFTDCLGWLSSSWKCGLCENYTCPDCFVILGKKKRNDKENPHICSKEDLETANLIRNNTKSCPKCGEAIEKAEGCDVMFCTSCHTGFNWKTSKILNGDAIHNPHYFEWLHQQGRQAQEGIIPNNCQGRLHPNMSNHTPLYNRNKLGNVIRILMHVEDVEFQNYSYHLQDIDNQELLIDYLIKKKTQDDVKKNIQVRERRREREKAIRDVLETLVHAGKDLVFPMSRRDFNEAEFDEYYANLNRLKDYVNENLKSISKMNGCVVPFIADNWTIVERYSQKSKKIEESV